MRRDFTCGFSPVTMRYEAAQTLPHSLVGFVTRYDGTVHTFRVYISGLPNEFTSSRVTFILGNYCIVPSGGDAHSTTSEKLWLVVRCLKERGVAVVEGDVVKLGRFRLKVKEAVKNSHEHELKRSRGRFPSNWGDLGGARDSDDECETVAPLEPLDGTSVPVRVTYAHEFQHMTLSLPFV